MGVCGGWGCSGERVRVCGCGRDYSGCVRARMRVRECEGLLGVVCARGLGCAGGGSGCTEC